MSSITKHHAIIDQFSKAVSNLREVLEKLKSAGDDRAFFRDSAIQRFEIAFDLSWKTLKEKLRLEYGVDALSPKTSFRESFKQGLLENNSIWIEMTDTRNETSHTYDESFAESVLLQLPPICDAFEKLLWKLKN
jgi:nucleotidyltransferase substrate binding protein (TIGR01987 family)